MSKQNTSLSKLKQLPKRTASPYPTSSTPEPQAPSSSIKESPKILAPIDSVLEPVEKANSPKAAPPTLLSPARGERESTPPVGVVPKNPESSIITQLLPHTPAAQEIDYDSDEQEKPPIEEDRQSFMSMSSFSDMEKYKNMQMVLEMITKASYDPVVVIDTKAQIKSCNREFLELFGYSRWEVIGKNILMLMQPKFAKNHDKYVQRYVKSKMKRIIGEKRDDIVAVRKDGSDFPVVLKVSELNSGNDTAFIGVLKNISFDQELHRIKQMITNMLPKSVSDKIQNGATDIAEEVTASVLFIDLVQFTPYMSKTPAKNVVQDLNVVFKYFDALCERFGLEKIKTIGDCYMAMCPDIDVNTDTQTYDYAIRIIEMVIMAIDFIRNETYFHVRCGVATGPVIQGVLSGKKLSFDIWGDTVNVSARLQSLSDIDGVMVDSQTYSETNFKYKYDQKKVSVKGKGDVLAFSLQHSVSVAPVPDKKNKPLPGPQPGSQAANAQKESLEKQMAQYH